MDLRINRIRIIRTRPVVESPISLIKYATLVIKACSYLVLDLINIIDDDLKSVITFISFMKNNYQDASLSVQISLVSHNGQV